MKGALKTGIILFLICAVSAGLCGIVNSITAPRIAENTLKETLEGYAAVSPGYDIGEEKAVEGNANVLSILPLSKDGKTEGAILNLTANGYGGAFNIIASYSLDGTLIKAKMMSNSETPGLGKKSEQSWYMAMFEGRGGSEALPASKSDLSSEDSQAVSGASITFNGVSTALRAGSDYIKSLGGVL